MSTVSLTVLNTSTSDFCELYLAPSSAADWGADRLSGGRINATETHTVSGLEPGNYDIQLVPCNLDEAEIYERLALDLGSDYELTLFDE